MVKCVLIWVPVIGGFPRTEELEFETEAEKKAFLKGIAKKAENWENTVWGEYNSIKEAEEAMEHMR